MELLAPDTELSLGLGDNECLEGDITPVVLSEEGSCLRAFLFTGSPLSLDRCSELFLVDRRFAINASLAAPPMLA